MPELLVNKLIETLDAELGILIKTHQAFTFVRTHKSKTCVKSFKSITDIISKNIFLKLFPLIAKIQEKMQLFFKIILC